MGVYLLLGDDEERKGRGVELTVAGRLLLDSVTRSLEVIRGVRRLF